MIPDWFDSDVSGICTVKKNGVNVAILLKAEGAAFFNTDDHTVDVANIDLDMEHYG